MKLRDALLPEFDREMANTRKALERIPEDKLGWKPHPKSQPMGWLGTHLANLPNWVVMTIDQDSLDLAPPGQPASRTEAAESRAEILERFDSNVKAARAKLEQVEDEHLLKPWSLLSGGQTIFTLPKTAVLRTYVMNHIVHHRGQLTVYLRLNDVPVPALYGPSADESGM